MTEENKKVAEYVRETMCYCQTGLRDYTQRTEFLARAVFAGRLSKKIMWQ